MAVIRPDWTNEVDRYAPPDQRAEAEALSCSVGNMDLVVQRLTGASMDEIDGVIHELEGMREMLRKEAERVSVDLAAFASVNQSSMSAMKIISKNLRNLRKGANHER
jgi:hypothetical protein